MPDTKKTKTAQGDDTKPKYNWKRAIRDIVGVTSGVGPGKETKQAVKEGVKKVYESAKTKFEKKFGYKRGGKIRDAFKEQYD